MIGYPKHLNSRQDVENLLQMPEYAAKVRETLQQLVAARFAWVNAGELAADDPGVEDDTHKVLSEEQGGLQGRCQMVLVEDSQALLFRLNLTVAEAETWSRGGGEDA